MQLLKQDKQEPNCFALSAVMVLRHCMHLERSWYKSEAHLENLLKFIGHRGQEIWWPECSGSQKLKGIHPQEIIDWYGQFGYTLWLLERFPRSAPHGLESRARMIWTQDEANMRFWSLLIEKPAILIMATHAVAWDGEKVFDPDERDLDFKNHVHEAWIPFSL